MVETSACRNEVVVGDADETRCRELRIAGESWIAGRRPEEGPVECKIRSTGEPVGARWETDGGIRFVDDSVRGAAPGQSAVLYRGEEVLGGGTIAVRDGG